MTALLLSLSLLLAQNAEERPAVLVVVGAPGTDDYAKQFRQWAARWRQAADRGGAEFAALGLESEQETGDRELLRQCLAERGQSSPAALWLVLIGHGTFDGKTAKFNLRGPDFSASELAEWLKPVERPLAIVNCASASGPFLNALSGPNRVVITATKSGHEHNFARFGDYLSAAVADPKADLDKDDQTSLLEAFLLAAARVEEFYKEESRLATEHALIDDNGDQLGTPADWFRGLRAAKVAKDGANVDGLRAGQLQLIASRGEQDLPALSRSRRDALELEIAELRRRKDAIAEDEYYRALEPLLLELARLYEPVDRPPTIQPQALDGN
ncbi:MAG TPA: hypothetical protein VN699_11530 [Pirellulales bacterium]|nr:hypothetical protein [Pirellulales bacterium]